MADPSLILDRRTGLAGTPGMHAVLIGVSDYEFQPAADDLAEQGLGALKKLQSSAISALALVRKLQSLDGEKRLLRPLKTVRLLQSPSPEEVQKEPTLGTLGAPANRGAIAAALREWRGDVADDPANQSFFYFCGHGVRRSLEESILLAADFRDPNAPKLFNSFRFGNVRNGMVPGPSFPNIGREQFYFIDACRDKPDALDTLDTTETPKIFDAELGGVDDRKAPVFFATLTGGVSAGVPGEPSFFAQALIWAMDNGSFEKQRVNDTVGVAWPVTPSSLKAGIEASDAFRSTRFEMGGQSGDPVLCIRHDAPHVPLAIALAPEPLPAPISMLSLTELNTSQQHDISPVDSAGPHKLDVAAGMYQMAVQPVSSSFQRSRSEIMFLSIRSRMPLLFDLGAVP